jgi:hypothetical protein
MLEFVHLRKNEDRNFVGCLGFYAASKVESYKELKQEFSEGGEMEL